MKNIKVTTLCFLLIQFIAISQDSDFDKTSYSKELAQRFLKLGNTYREAQNYDKADHYLTKGINLAQKYKQKYWIAVGYEYLGYLQRDIGNIEASKEFLFKAKSVYLQIIGQSDGSQIAINDVINSLDNRKTVSSTGQNDEIIELRSEIQNLKNTNEKYLTRIETLEEEIKLLKDDLSNEKNINKKQPPPIKGNVSEKEDKNFPKYNENQANPIDSSGKEIETKPKSEIPKEKVKRKSLPTPINQ